MDELAAAERIVERYAELRLVINHLGRPPIANGDPDAWAERIARLARSPNVFLKVSGLLPVAVHKPYVAHAMRAFGAERLLFGSDWPFLLQAVDAWKKVLAAFTQALGAQPMEIRSRILGENAMDLYGIASDRNAS